MPQKKFRLIEKKNRIWIGRTGKGYFINCKDNNYIHTPFGGETRQEEYETLELKGVSLNDAINGLTDLSYQFYSRGIKINIQKEATEEMPKKDLETLEKVIRRLERCSIQNKKLTKRLTQINTLSKID